MRVTRLRLRDFRSYDTATVALGERVTVVTGANGAGKTNLLEALYFGCVGRSCRTANEREVVRFGQKVARVEIAASSDLGEHEISVGFSPGEPKRITVDGASVERLQDSETRPLVAVFLPERLDLVKGTPAVRRAHVDQLVAALWPARVATRRRYAQALAQRNALLGRLRSGRGSRESLAAWDSELARHGVALMQDRRAAVAEIEARFIDAATSLGLDGEAAVAYRPRSAAGDPESLAAELAARLESDLERGFTGHGPHRDELALTRAGRDLRAYGSQGQQRLAVLALLLAEREAIAGLRPSPPLMLLDDVMSELDPDRRASLLEVLGGAGQSVITTADPDHVPRVDGVGVEHVAVRDGAVLQEARAA
ncbi:MAG: replication and repair protein RecF [Solirubrobacteraceae bacterium]|nr:replication and repair protein RecF [Solirubrobacteraceae bacterium]